MLLALCCACDLTGSSIAATRCTARDAERTGWPLRFAADVRETPPPTEAALTALYALRKRTAEVHGMRGVSE